MGTRNGESNIAEDRNVEQAYQKYKHLRQIVEKWQQKDNSNWLEALELADTPPYISVKEFPIMPIIELWQQLNSFSNMDVPNSRLEAIWKEFKNDKNITDAVEEGILLNLQLAINGTAQIIRQAVVEKMFLIDLEDTNQFSTTMCPICGETPSVVVLKAPNGHRVIHCSTCDFEWPALRIGCIYCNNTEAKKQMYLKNDIFPGIEAVACTSCGNFFKEIDTRELLVRDFIWEDLRTIPLNYATELWLKENVSINMV